jgi:hypothetical protein
MCKLLSEINRMKDLFARTILLRNRLGTAMEHLGDHLTGKVRTDSLPIPFLNNKITCSDDDTFSNRRKLNCRNFRNPAGEFSFLPPPPRVDTSTVIRSEEYSFSFRLPFTTSSNCSSRPSGSKRSHTHTHTHTHTHKLNCLP